MNKKDFVKIYNRMWKSKVNKLPIKNSDEKHLQHIYLNLTSIICEQIKGNLESQDYYEFSELLKYLLTAMKLKN